MLHGNVFYPELERSSGLSTLSNRILPREIRSKEGDGTYNARLWALVPGFKDLGGVLLGAALLRHALFRKGDQRIMLCSLSKIPTDSVGLDLLKAKHPRETEVAISMVEKDSEIPLPVLSPGDVRGCS